MANLVSFSIDQIPNFLKHSEFYCSLDVVDDELILPNNVCKFDLHIASTDEMSHLLSTMRFWGTSKIPTELVQFVVNNPTLDVSPILADFSELRGLDFLRILGDRVRHISPNLYFKGSVFTFFMKRKGSLIEDVVYILSDQFEREMGQVWNTDTCAIAAQLGWLDCLTFLHDNGCPWSETTCACAALEDRLDCLTYAHTQGCPWDAQTTNNALANRHVRCLQYARSRGCPWNEETCAAAALRQELPLLKFLHEAGCPWDVTTAKNAVSNFDNNIACLQYAFENGCPWDETVCAEAVSRRNLAALSFAHENGCPWDSSVVKSAASSGHMDCFKYALDNGCPGKDSACLWATSHIECLKYAREEHNCPWDVKVVNHCADFKSYASLEYCLTHGCPTNADTAKLCASRVDFLKLARENGCPWDENTCASAAKSGSLECLTFAREHGCPWDKSVLENAASYGHLDCLKYALDNGCPGKDSACLWATSHVECLKYAREEHNCPWDVEVVNRCTFSWLDASLEYCLTHGCPTNTETAKLCVSRVHLLKLAREHGCPWDALTMHTAAKNGCIDSLEYAWDNGCPGREDVLLAAAENLAALQFIHSRGVPLRPVAYEKAISGAKPLECVRFLFDYGCAWSSATCPAFAKYKALDCLEFAHKNGAQWDKSTTAAAARLQNRYYNLKEEHVRALQCLRYLHEAGCPWDGDTCAAAAESGNLACLQYAHERGCPWDYRVRRSTSWGSPCKACVGYAELHGCPKWSVWEIGASVSVLIVVPAVILGMVLSAKPKR